MSPFKFSLFVFATMLAVSLPAYAGIGIDLNKIPAIQTWEMLPQAEFESATKVEREDKPYKDDLLSYEIRLPKDWTANVQEASKELKVTDKKMSDTVLSILARYIGPAKNLTRSYISVEALQLSSEIGVKNWFVNFVLRNGFSLDGLSEHSDMEVEALYVQVINDQTYAVRTRVMINGARLIMVRYYLPQDNFVEERSQMAQVIGSFKLLSPSTKRIEGQKTYAFLDQSYFDYPDTWGLRGKPIYSIERMNATIYQQQVLPSQETVLEGQIKVDVVSKLLKTTLAQEVKAFREGVNIRGYKVGKLIEPVKYTYDPSIKAANAQVYELVPQDPLTMKSYEFLVTIMEGADFYYITSMITPARDQEFLTWARNMETAKIVNQSMRRGNTKYDPNDPYYDYLKD